MAGDQATYSIAFQNLANVDAPYTVFEYGAPELLLNEHVRGLPYMDYFTNLRGTPEGAAGTDNENVPWPRLDTIINRDGQFNSAGVLIDHPADGFAGLSFNIITYPGLRALAEQAFDKFRSQMANRFPELDSILDEGGESAIGDWWEGVKDKVSDISPQLGGALGQIDFVGLYEENQKVPNKCEIPFIPYRTHAYAAATTLNFDEFVAYQSQQARELRQAIIDSDDVPGSLLALGLATTNSWVDLYLTGLEQAGILRPQDQLPPVRDRQYIVSATATLASGILFGPAGTDIRSNADLLGFFEQLRTL